MNSLLTSKYFTIIIVLSISAFSYVIGFDSNTIHMADQIKPDYHNYIPAVLPFTKTNNQHQNHSSDVPSTLKNILYFPKYSLDNDLKFRKIIGSSIPIHLLKCANRFTILRCAKIYILQKLENTSNFSNSGNLAEDFKSQFLVDDNRPFNLFDKKYKNMSDLELTKRLTFNLHIFFKERPIQFNFLPSMMIQIISSPENNLGLSLKTYGGDITGRRRTDKPSYKNKMLQMAVPVLMMPVILLGTFLPFMIPALKMATIMSTLINNGALIAALLYAARTSAQQSDAEVIHYSHPGYH